MSTKYYAKNKKEFLPKTMMINVIKKTILHQKYFLKLKNDFSSLISQFSFKIKNDNVLKQKENYYNMLLYVINNNLLKTTEYIEIFLLMAQVLPYKQNNFIFSKLAKIICDHITNQEADELFIKIFSIRNEEVFLNLYKEFKLLFGHIKKSAYKIIKNPFKLPKHAIIRLYQYQYISYNNVIDYFEHYRPLPNPHSLIATQLEELIYYENCIKELRNYEIYSNYLDDIIEIKKNILQTSAPTNQDIQQIEDVVLNKINNDNIISEEVRSLILQISKNHRNIAVINKIYQIYIDNINKINTIDNKYHLKKLLDIYVHVLFGYCFFNNQQHNIQTKISIIYLLRELKTTINIKELFNYIKHSNYKEFLNCLANLIDPIIFFKLYNIKLIAFHSSRFSKISEILQQGKLLSTRMSKNNNYEIRNIALDQVFFTTRYCIALSNYATNLDNSNIFIVQLRIDKILESKIFAYNLDISDVNKRYFLKYKKNTNFENVDNYLYYNENKNIMNILFDKLDKYCIYFKFLSSELVCRSFYEFIIMCGYLEITLPSCFDLYCDLFYIYNFRVNLLSEYCL